MDQQPHSAPVQASQPDGRPDAQPPKPSESIGVSSGQTAAGPQQRPQRWSVPAFRNHRRTAVVVLVLALGGAAAGPVSTAADCLHMDQPRSVRADAYYGPSGNQVTWPVGPAIF